MGIFDFFKKRKEKDKPKEIKIISLKDLSPWVEKRSSELEQERNNFNLLMKNNISKLCSELKRGVTSLNNIGWEKIKVEYKIKQIVKENLGNYISHLEKLIFDLESLKEADLTKNKIVSIFSAFEKKAGMNYQKSTFLIGKEMEIINNGVAVFFREIERIYKENNELLQTLENISSTKEKLEKLNQLDRVIFDFKEEINKMDEKISELEKEIEKREAEINRIRKEAEYLEWMEEKNKLNGKKEKLNIEMEILRGAIDFKTLAKLWHENPKEMSIVKEYRENFYKAFEKDKGKFLTGLINLLDNQDIINKAITEIINLEKEIENTKIEMSPSFKLEEKIEKAKAEILDLRERKIIESKKIDKLLFNRTSFLSALNSNLFDLGLRLS